MKIFYIGFFLNLSFLTLVSCDTDRATQPWPPSANIMPVTDFVDSGGEHPFIRVSEVDQSTFSVDVDTASYSYARKSLESGSLPEKERIRTEEFVNYFRYTPIVGDFKDQKIDISYEVDSAHWAPQNRLVKVDVQAKEIPLNQVLPLNLVFLIDVSGSMKGRLELVKFALKTLLNEFREQDCLSIVTYGSEVATLLNGKTLAQKAEISDAIESLTAGGGTAGHAGLQTAYKVAQQNFKSNGVNRVILSTDGDFNVGLSDPDKLQAYIKDQAKEAVFLTVHGYGMGNYNDEMLEKITNSGNGNYAYIDNKAEAKKVFKMQITQTLSIAAKDVKIQMLFNPHVVEAFRLIGYENRILENEDFDNDHIDSGDMGSGHRVTAFYELKLRADRPEAVQNLYLTMKLRYKDVDQKDAVRELKMEVRNSLTKPSSDFCFAASVAAYALKLGESRYINGATWEDIKGWAQKCDGYDTFPERGELLELLSKASTLSTLL